MTKRKKDREEERFEFPVLSYETKVLLQRRVFLYVQSHDNIDQMYVARQF